MDVGGGTHVAGTLAAVANGRGTGGGRCMELVKSMALNGFQRKGLNRVRIKLICCKVHRLCN